MSLFGPPDVEKLKRKRDVEGLLQVLHAERAYTRAEAAEALGELQDPRAVDGLVKASADEDERVRQTAASALTGMGDDAVQGLTTVLATNNNADARFAAVAILERLGSVEPLVGALGDSTKRIRRRSIQALGRLKDSRALEPLAALLRDQEEKHDIRSEAARALGALGDVRAVEPLSEALNDHQSVPKAAAKALGTLDEPDAVEPLIAALRNSDPDVRSIAAKALGRRRDARAVEPLLAAIEVGNVSGAARALGELEDERADGPLLKAAEDAGDTKAFQKFGGVLPDAAQLHREGDIDGLVEMLGSPFPDVRIKAAEALGSLGDNAAVKHLSRVLRQDTFTTDSAYADGLSGDDTIHQTTHPVRLAAAAALRQIGSSNAESVLAKHEGKAEPKQW